MSATVIGMGTSLEIFKIDVGQCIRPNGGRKKQSALVAKYRYEGLDGRLSRSLAFISRFTLSIFPFNSSNIVTF